MMTSVTAPPSATDTDRVADVAVRLRLGATRLARLLRQQSDARLTPTQVAALATLDRCGPIPLGALADAEQIAPPTATKVVDKLQHAGLVARVPDPDDGRVRLVSVTDAGHALLEDVRARKTAWLVTALGDLPAHDLDALAAAVDVLERLVAPGDPRP